MEFEYADIIHMQRPVHVNDAFSRAHPPMSRQKRAKIFAPYAALKGFDEAVQAKTVLYEPRHILDTDEAEALNRQLNRLLVTCGNGPNARRSAVTVTVEYFVPCADVNHEAYGRLGQYRQATGVVRRIDITRQELRIGETCVQFRDIWRISEGEPPR